MIVLKHFLLGKNLSRDMSDSFRIGLSGYNGGGDVITFES